MNIKIINRDYTVLLSGQLISILGNIINGTATMWIAYEILGSGNKTGLLFGLSTIPALILMPFIGNLIDMFNRKYLMFFCDLLAGISSIILAILTYKNMLGFWNLSVILSIDTILFSLVASTRSSLIQNLVKQNEYLKANSISALVQNVAKVSLPMVGALLIAKFQVASCFLIDGFSFFIAAFFTLAITSYEFKQTKEETFFTKFYAGLKYIKVNTQYLNFIFLLAFINFIGASDMMLIRILIDKASLHVNFFGIFKSSLAIGSILIAFLISRNKSKKYQPQRDKKLMSSALILNGLAYLLFGLYGQKHFLLFGGLLSGIGNTMFNVAFFSYMQTYILKEYYGRVISLVFFVSQIAQPLSYWVFGALADVLSVYLIFTLGGLSLFIIAALFYKITMVEKHSYSIN